MLDDGAAGTAAMKVATAGVLTKVIAGGLVVAALGGGVAVATRPSDRAPVPMSTTTAAPSAATNRAARPSLDTTPPVSPPADETLPGPEALPDAPPVIRRAQGAPSAATAGAAAAGAAAASSVAPSSAAPSSPSSAPESSHAREIRSLDEARAALDRGEAAATLALLDRHGRTFPDGALGSVAAVLRAEALLASGDRLRAQKLARELLARDPAGPHARRLTTIAGAAGTDRP
jgi:hypothetical protein